MPLSKKENPNGKKIKNFNKLKSNTTLTEKTFISLSRLVSSASYAQHLKKIFILFFCLLFSASFAQQEKAESEKKLTEQGLNNDLPAEQIIKINKPALVSIWYYSSGYYSFFGYESADTILLNGSGFIFMEDGFIGTNYHVVDGLDSILIKTSNGTFYNAELIITDEKNDIAILRIIDSSGTKFPVVKFGNSDDVVVGQNVYAIGSPLGFEYTISDGIVAALRENEKVNFNDPVTYMPVEKVFDKVIQITAAISPGNSGGALFNSKGEIIGITTYSYGFYGNLNFAVAINTLRNIISKVNLYALEQDEEFQKRRQINIYNTNLKMAQNYQSKVYSNWYYTKEKDTMKTIDTFIVKQDSVNKVNLNKAYSYYYKCIEMRPDSFNVYRELLDLYIYVEDFKKAENLYRDIKEKFVSDSLINTLSSSLAQVYSSSKNYSRALDFYEKMLKTDSTDVFTYYQIANIHESRKSYGKAIRIYNKLIRMDSNNTSAYVKAGRLYYEKYKDYKKAYDYLITALEKEIMNYGSATSDIDLHFYLGMIAVKEGRKIDAVLAYLDMKNIYTYTPEDNNKKLKLYREIIKMK